MNIYLKENNIDFSNIYLHTKTNKNNKYIKIIYSTPFYSINGIWLDISSNQKIHYTFLNNKYIIELKISDKIKELEHFFVKKYSSCKIYKPLPNEIILYSDKKPNDISSKIIINISTIWESTFSFGLNYKTFFIH